MLYFVLIILSVGILVSSVPTCTSKPYYDTELAEVYFEEFMNTFNKTYGHETEKQRRMEIFRNNLKKINELNGDPTESAHFGINHFTDLTEEELQMYKCFKPCPMSHHETYEDLSIPDGPVPDGFDWREKGVVSRVKSQGICRSCWAFSAAGVVESVNAIKYHNLSEVSEQELVDCSSTRGCNGGDPYFGLKYYHSKGADSESSYPYMAQEQKCQFQPKGVIARLSNVIYLKPKNEDILANALMKYGPISVAVSPVTDWYQYAGGVLENCKGGHHNTAVLLVGFGSDKGTPYWILKNSWGPDWGEQGYIRIRRGGNNCNILDTQVCTAVAA